MMSHSLNGARSGSDEPAPLRSLILVVDDEIHIVDVVSAVLEDEGYAVVQAHDGMEGWELTFALHPALVISDVMMPKMSGIELLSRVRHAGDGVSRTPFILMSAVTRAELPDNVRFIEKPFDLDDLLALVGYELASA